MKVTGHNKEKMGNKITDEKIIRHCFDQHVKDCGGNVRFTFEQYSEFWLQHNPGDQYQMVNKNAPPTECKIVYFPIAWTYEEKLNKQKEIISSDLKPFNDLRALVEIYKKDGFDFREVPVHFLENVSNKSKL